MKDRFIAAHEELIEEYLDSHPCATEAQAYAATADYAYDRLRDNLADRIDAILDRAREAR